MTDTSLRIGGLHVDRLTHSETLDAITRLVTTRVGGYVVTPNLDHLALARRDAVLRDAYAGASLSVADGAPLVWLSHLRGRPLPERVSGADLVAPLLTRAEQAAWRVFLVGGTPAVAEQLRSTMSLRWPSLRIVGHDTGVWNAQAAHSQDATAVALQHARPDLVFVALGCPKQEYWMHCYGAQLRPAVCVGVGGALDFLAGAVQRAPAWLGRCGGEWLFRLAQEPRRLAGRYLWRDPQVIPPLVLDALQQRFKCVPKRENDRPTRLIPGPTHSHTLRS